MTNCKVTGYVDRTAQQTVVGEPTAEAALFNDIEGVTDCGSKPLMEQDMFNQIDRDIVDGMIRKLAGPDIISISHARWFIQDVNDLLAPTPGHHMAAIYRRSFEQHHHAWVTKLTLEDLMHGKGVSKETKPPTLEDLMHGKGVSKEAESTLEDLKAFNTDR